MKTLVSMCCVLGVIGLFLICGPVQAAEPGALKAGVARVDITPEQPVKLSGYASRQGLSTGVHDPLSARVLAFEFGGRRLVLVSLDLIGFYGGTGDYLRAALQSEFDLRDGELFLCAIHTHSAPSPTLDKDNGHPNNVAYTEGLRGRLVTAVAEALGRLEPAQVGLGAGSSPVGVNRRELRIRDNGETSIVLGRNAEGPTDKEVLVLKVTRPDGAPLAVAFDYATHATCLGPGNYAISGDVLGLAEQFVEKVQGAEVIAPAFAGASGDIDPWFRVLPAFTTDSGWVPEPVLLGTFLGEEVVHVCRRIDSTVPVDGFACAFATLQLPAKRDPESSSGAKPSSVPFNVTVARLGDIAFVGLGGEVLNGIGKAIKQGSPCARTFVITHCNGAAGYLVPGDLFIAGGYEVGTTPFAPQAADIVARAAIKMLHDL